MASPLYQFVVDAQIALHKRAASEEQIARAWHHLERDGFKFRLSHYLQEQGSISNELATEIDSAGQVSSALLADSESSSTELETLAELPSRNKTKHPDPQGELRSVTEVGLDTFVEEEGSYGNEQPRENKQEHRASELRFKKVGLHDEGGLGQVWLAEDLELPRRVALKEIQPSYADELQSRQRFTLEASITGALEHPGIVPVYGLGASADGRPYYAMRFIKGQTLKQAIEELHSDAPKRPFRNKQWFERFRKLLNRFLYVCNTIEYAHSRGVIHRDIKPSNIMLGDYEETLVVDWGLSKQIDQGDSEASANAKVGSSPPLPGSDSNLTFDGAAIGTPAYMSPEQAAGGRAGPVAFESDVFSLGATLFHLAVGTPPKNIRGMPEVYKRELADLPPPLASICLKCLNPKVPERFATAAALAADIERWMTGQAVEAHRESRLESLNRWIGNHPTAVTSTLVATAFAFFASLAGIITYSQVRYSIDMERQQRTQLAQQHKTQVMNSAESNIESARLEIRNGRFRSALEFLEQTIALLNSEPDLQSQLLLEAQEIHDRTSRLVSFYDLTQKAEELAFRDSSRRSSVIFQKALVAANVFKQREWWNALPSDELTPRQLQELRERVYRSIFLLAALRLKETLPDELDVLEMLKIVSAESKESNAAALVLFDLLDAYRQSQGSQLGRMFAENRQQLFAKALSSVAFQQPLIEWKARNAADLYVMGSALSYMCVFTDEKTREPFAKLLGIKDADDAAKQMLQQASEIQKDQYWTQIVRAFFEEQRGEHDNAWRSYLHTISLDPSNWVGHAWLGRAQRAYAVQSFETDDPQRDTFFSRAKRNLEVAIDLNPLVHSTHYEIGHTLTWDLGDPRETLASYALALELQEPLDLINDVAVQAVDEENLRLVRDWSRDAAATWELVEVDACQAWAELLLRDYAAAESAANQAILKDERNRIALMVLGTLRIRENKLSEARKLLLAIADRNSWYPALVAIARLEELSGNLERSLELFQQATRIAEPDWQQLEARRNIARLSFMLDKPAAVDRLKQAIQASLTEPLEDVAIVIGDEPLARRLLEEHHASLEPIIELSNAKLVESLPLFNGSFELGFTRCWGDSLEEIGQPTWKRYGGSIARAETSELVADSGTRSLHISNSVRRKSDANSFAELTQRFPVKAGEEYVLRAAFLTYAGEAGAIEICVDEQVIMQSPVGNTLGPRDEDWQVFSRQFKATQPQATLSIRCRGQCDVYLDSLQLTVE